MVPELESVLDQILADYSRVEPAPEAVNRWVARATQQHRRWSLPMRSGPAWAGIALILLLLLGIFWYRGHARSNTQPILANEHTVLVPAKPQNTAPLTDEQKRLIQLLQHNPAALATQHPGDANPGKKVKHP